MGPKASAASVDYDYDAYQNAQAHAIHANANVSAACADGQQLFTGRFNRTAKSGWTAERQNANHFPMQPEVIQALEKQATHELYASQSYLALAYWSDVRQYSGFAEFFHLQVKEEREHADKFFKFLADRDVVPTLGEVKAPKTDFNNLSQAAKWVYDLERANTAGIHAAYEIALKANDYATQVMLHWFIHEQVEEEAWSDKLLVKVQEATCPGALHMLDHHILKELRKKAETP